MEITEILLAKIAITFAVVTFMVILSGSSEKVTQVVERVGTIGFLLSFLAYLWLP